MKVARAFLVLVLIFVAAGARAQPPAAPGQPPVADSTISDRREATNDQSGERSLMRGADGGGIATIGLLRELDSLTNS